ncbi:hypothetical protein CEXT_31251 [Caerostris extrusa]|uniref:Uncharacterized protein n=1 Tax=Caerostris extrusa TaxID=172846 RepID=A0AAV4XBE7_CAEEX|nr:hypothetical protein CEXT_31251 [Caerostris extrusa]
MNCFGATSKLGLIIGKLSFRLKSFQAIHLKCKNLASSHTPLMLEVPVQAKVIEELESLLQLNWVNQRIVLSSIRIQTVAPPAESMIYAQFYY